MRPAPFKLERFFAEYEFSAPYLLCSSDIEPLSMKELLEMSDPTCKALWDGLVLGYTESKGHPLLLKEISQLYKGINTKDVLVLAPEEGIFIAMNSMIEEGDHVITAYPAYQSLYELANARGATISHWEVQEEEHGWHFSIDKLEQLIRPETKLLVVNFPHNPTGAMISRKEFDHLIELCKQNDVFLFFDEMYRFMEHEEANRLPSACEVYEKAVSLGGMSKVFSLPGLRLGWLITRNVELMQRFTTLKDYTTICSSAPSEILAIIALRAKDRIFARNKKLLLTNLEKLNTFFENHRDMFEWNAPIVGPIGFASMNSNWNIEGFYKQLVEEAGILLAPASAFGIESNSFRVSFARKNMPEVLERFDAYLKKKE